MINECESCGEEVTYNEEFELVHKYPYNTELPHRCDPRKVKK